MSYLSEQNIDSPLSRWKFEETSGTAIDDDLTATRDGTINGSVTLNQAPQLIGAGYGASFDGSSGYVGIGNASGLLGIGAVEAIVVFDSIPASNANPIFSHAWSGGQIIPLVIGFNLDGAHAGKLQAGYFTSSVWVTVTWSTAPSTGTAYHLVATYDGTNLSLYANGSQVATTVVGTARPGAGTVNATAYIGRRWDVAQFHSGTIWDVAIYASALSGARVTAHYNAVIDDGLAPAISYAIGKDDLGNLDISYELSQGYGVAVTIDVTGDVTQSFPGGAGRTGKVSITGLLVGTTYNLTLTPSNTYGSGSGYPLSVTLSSNAFDDLVLTDTPAVFLDLQETTGRTAFDRIVSSNNGAYQAGVALNDGTDSAAPANVGSHVRLDGTASYIQLAGGSWLTPASGFTFEACFYIRSWATSVRLFDFSNVSSTDDMYLAANGSGTMTLKVNGTAMTFSRPSTGQWVHFVVTVTSAGSAVVYVDGAISATGTVGAPVNGTRSRKFIGKSNYSADPYLAASVSHIALYNSVLAPARVAQHAEAAQPYVNAQIAAVSSEALATPTYSSPQVAAVAAETLTDVTRPNAQFAAVAVEVIVKIRRPFVGWGSPIW